MIKSITKMQAKRRMRNDKMPVRKFATNTIKILQALLNERQAKIPTRTVEDKWNAFKSIEYKVSKQKLGTAVSKHKDLVRRK